MPDRGHSGVVGSAPATMIPANSLCGAEISGGGGSFVSDAEIHGKNSEFDAVHVCLAVG